MTGRASLGERYRAFWHRAGLLWNRLVGALLLVIGGYALLLSFGSESFSFATHWPTLIAVAALWALSRSFFKARDAVIEPVDGEGHPGDPILRLDLGLGIVWARICGTLFALGGGWALLSVVALPDYAFTAYWPVFALSALLFAAAWACFRARVGLMDQLSEGPRDPPAGPAARP
jgi:hypothetical protein